MPALPALIEAVVRTVISLPVSALRPPIATEFSVATASAEVDMAPVPVIAA